MPLDIKIVPVYTQVIEHKEFLKSIKLERFFKTHRTGTQRFDELKVEKILLPKLIYENLY